MSWSNDANVDNRHGLALITRKQACATKWIGHPGNQDIAKLEWGAPQSARSFPREKSGGFVKVDAIPYVRQLNESDIALWILVLCLDPIPVNEYFGIFK